MAKEEITTRSFGGEEYLNLSNAAKYVGYTNTGFRDLLERRKGTGEAVDVWEFGGNGKYIKKSDLDQLFKPRLVKE